MTTSTRTPQIGAIWMELVDLKLLRTLMKSHGVSQRQLAVVAGYRSHAYMGRILRGEVRTLEPTPAARIAHYFAIDLDVLFRARSSTNQVHHDQRRRGRVKVA